MDQVYLSRTLASVKVNTRLYAFQHPSQRFIYNKYINIGGGDFILKEFCEMYFISYYTD